MKHGIFATLFYIPLYNGLVFLIDILPGHSAGFAIVLLTLIIRLVLFPLSRKSIKTQLQMKQIEPDVQRIKNETKDKQEQAKRLLELYKEREINPFAGFFLILIQLPILIALYKVFRSGLPAVDPTLLYSFIEAPKEVFMTFIGIDLMQKSIILALITAITQYIQISLSLPTPPKKDPAVKSNVPDFAQTMNTQMKYVFPVLIFFIASVSAVIGLYLAISNIFMILQEIFVRRKLMKQYGLEKKPV